MVNIQVRLSVYTFASAGLTDSACQLFDFHTSQLLFLFVFSSEGLPLASLRAFSLVGYLFTFIISIEDNEGKDSQNVLTNSFRIYRFVLFVYFCIY